ncbi:MAG: hypothetical protein Tsb0020_54880 [Haliangiales bacterium]
MSAALPLALLFSVATVGACASQQKIDDLTVRVAALEQRHAEADDTQERLARLEAQSQRLLGLNEAIASQLSQLSDLQEMLAGMRAELDDAPPRRPQRPRGPDPDAVYAVPIDGSPFEGPANAKVTIVKAFEFACPFCERSRATIDQIRDVYGRDVRVVYKHYIVHPSTATLPAQAACAADQQEKFPAMMEAIWERGYKAGRDLSRENMERIARRLKLNMKRFKRDMDGPCVERVQRDQAAMAKIGVTGTPAFFINGRFIRGAQPFDAFKLVIDQELERANQAIQGQGIPQAKYYQHVVDGGRTAP